MTTTPTAPPTPVSPLVSGTPRGGFRDVISNPKYGPVLITAVLFVLMRSIRKHYDRVRDELALDDVSAARALPTVGSAVALALDERHLHLFDADTGLAMRA